MMNTLLFFDRKFNHKDTIMVNEELPVIDIVSTQKIELKTAVTNKVSEGDFVISKTTKFIYTVVGVSFNKNIKTITMCHVDEIFNFEAIIGSLSGSIFNWIKTQIETNISDTDDELAKIPVIINNELQTNYTAVLEMPSGNFKECLKAVFDISGTFLSFDISYESGKPVALIVNVKNNNDISAKKIKHNLPIVTNIRRVYTQSQNKNKLILLPESSEGDTVNFYLLKNGTLTTNSAHADRFELVNQAVKYYKDDATAEDLVDSAKQELLGQEYNHNIEFDILENKSYKLNVYDKVEFIDIDATYNSIVSKVTVKNKKIKTIVLGVVRRTLTDKLKNTQSKTTATAQSSGGGGQTQLAEWGDIAGVITEQADLMEQLNNRVPNTIKINNKTLTDDITLTATDTGAISVSQKGMSGGVAELDDGGKVPSTQLPSYVDDVLEFAKLSDFSTTGETGKIYIAKDTNKQYRWSGSDYVEISKSIALGETSATAYRGDRGKEAYDHSQTTDGTNPHNTTFENINNKPTTLSGYGITDGATKDELANKVDKVSGKGLSTNDYDNTEKTKLAGIQNNANNYTLPLATDAVIGGVKATAKTSEYTSDVRIDTTSGRLYSKPVSGVVENLYEVIIKTQAEFNDIVSSSDWLGAKTVAIIGGGGSGTNGAYVYGDSSVGGIQSITGIVIPQTVVQLDGFLNTKIIVSNVGENASGVSYSQFPESDVFSISGLDVTAYGSLRSIAFFNCMNISNCVGRGISTGTNSSSTGKGFVNCKKISNCTGIGEGFYSSQGFDICHQLSDCSARGISSGGHVGYGFRACNYGSNCIDLGSTTKETFSCHFWSLSSEGGNAIPIERVVDAQNAAKLKGTDTRDINAEPQWYFSKAIGFVSEFKQSSVIGLSDSYYCLVLTNVPWSDASGGLPSQVAYMANGNIYKRAGASATTWGAWVRFADSKDINNTSKIIAELTLANNANSMTISDLDLNADGGVYDFVFIGSGSGSDALYCYVNNVTTGYNSSINRANGTATGAGAIANQCYAFVSTAYVFMGDILTNTNIFVTGTIKKLGNLINIHGNASMNKSGNQSNGVFGGTNSNSISNVTSFTIQAGVGINIIAGAKLIIYKRGT